ncbi:MAG: helix-turn-helix domain-containing protein [Candidatus Spechtbacterales bacterium]
MSTNQLQQLSTHLQVLGLQEKEAKVYVASSFLGPSPVQQIAKQAGINRPTAYVILEQLAEKGLVSESTEEKKAVYVPEPPEALERWLEKQEKELEFKKRELKEMIPKLKNTHRENIPDAPQVRFYRGLDGINAVLAESFRKAKSKSEVYGFTNIDRVQKIFPKYFTQAPSKRVKKSISSKVLYWSTKTDEPSDEKLLRTTQKIDAPPKADITLFEDRATLLTYNDKDSVGIVIESKDIVGALRQVFELAWKNQDTKEGEDK